MLLNRPKNIDVARMVIEEYINANYIVNGKLTFENINGTHIVNCSGTVKVKNKKIEKLTDGFVWGVVGGDFDCSYCINLKSLEGAPEKVVNFSCLECDNLKSLEGSPKEVRGFFVCTRCDGLESLEGMSKKIGRSLSCAHCKNLKSLKGAPKKVGMNFYCHGCENLKSLEGAPEKVRGDFYCRNCKNLRLTDEDRQKYKICDY